MNTVDVGVQRFTVTRSAPAAVPAPTPPLQPGDAVTLSGMDLAPSTTATAGRLDAEFFADPGRALAMVAHWTQDQLYVLANALMDEGDRRGKAELLELLRWLCKPGGPDDPEPRAVKVEFVTDAYEDGVYWHDDEIFIHRADGTVEPYEWPEDDHQDDDWRAKADRYRALLADYSRSDHPAGGDHLVVDLSTGEFEHTGKWSLV